MAAAATAQAMVMARADRAGGAQGAGVLVPAAEEMDSAAVDREAEGAVWEEWAAMVLLHGPRALR